MQFAYPFAELKYWINFHEVYARNTDMRTAIACVMPSNRFCADTAQTTKNYIAGPHLVFLVALFNPFVADWEVRQRVTAHMDMHFVYKMRIPRLIEKDAAFHHIVRRAAHLICTTPEFDNLAREVGLKGHMEGATDPVERARLRAELDGLVAHLYGLTEEEFSYILTTFPLVPDPVKTSARNAYRDVEKGLIT